MQRKWLWILLSTVTAYPCISQALTFDVRGGYRAGSHTYESRYKVSESWKTGWWASLETDNKNNKNNGRGNNGTDKSDGAHSFGDSKTDYNELESNYTFPLSEKWSLQPGGIYHWSSSGTQIRPYIRLNYKITENLNTALRYRYDYNTYETVSGSGESHRDSVNRLDAFLGYKISPKWSVLWQGTVYKHVNEEYKYKNDKSWSTENAFTLRYKWNNWFSPYVEYDYLDKQGFYEGEDCIAESRYRIGMTFTL